WEKSFLFGTPILRPFLGKEWTPVSVDDTEASVSFQINLYPNPVNDILYIILSDKIEPNDIQMEIFTVNGQRIYSGNYRENINISNYQSGFYVLKAYHKTTREMLQSKFIVYH
ncbi:MAG: T9SS type A sorting domain-containing protein, partial [Bacteroidales bacterium]|nr:T9SS type A sorting domain-containing protein [Bacteroidales bacterium]